jgi:hypothetical protein
MCTYEKVRRRFRVLALVAALLTALLVPTVAAQGASGPPSTAKGHTQKTLSRTLSSPRTPPPGDPWVVSLGDSYISGEGGRWAGNTDGSSSRIDALGPTAYFDNPTRTAELIPRCHRSESAEIHIGVAHSLNLACSGARTYTFTDSGGYFKPGLDFYDVNGHQGQALMLRNFALTHRVTMVAVSIGGNDFGFGDVVTTCFEDYYFFDRYCKDDPTITSRFDAASAARVTSQIVQALRNVRAAMLTAGYPDDSYRVLVQNYPSPIPFGNDFRYPQNWDRQNVGGCGLWNVDADWALNTAMPTVTRSVGTAVIDSGMRNIVTMDVSREVGEHKLCQKGVGLLEEQGLNSWKDPGAVDKTEWINQIRVFTLGTNYFQQESMHPNFWAQLGLRNCLRQAYANGVAHGGTCIVAGRGLTIRNEPVMALLN